MQSVTLKAYGGIENLEIVDRPTPKHTPHAVRVENHCLGVNPVDCGVRDGTYRFLSGIFTPPPVLGADFAGVVKEVGGKVTQFCVGDRVVGMLSPFKGGAYAEEVVCPAKQLVKAPAHLPFDQLGGLPLAALTAYQALVHMAQLRAGQRVLINGATGGVGHFAVQIAKRLGAEVIATCHPDNADTARAMGASTVLSYHDDYVRALSDVDVFFDVAATRTFPTIKRCLSAEGTYITSLPTAHSLISAPVLNLFTAQKNTYVAVKPNADDLRTLVQWMGEGALHVWVHRAYTIDDIAQAHMRIRESGVIGKLVVKLKA